VLYFLIPWTAVNLIDYFFISKGKYSTVDLFNPGGIYGAWGWKGLFAYVVGFAASIPFFVVPNLYTGRVAALIGGCDIGWLVSLTATSAAYLAAQAVSGRLGVPAPATVLSKDQC
jgi:purine-cytosine permease-like protein